MTATSSDFTTTLAPRQTLFTQTALNHVNSREKAVLQMDFEIQKAPLIQMTAVSSE
jgi:hypothetical protein